MGYQYYIEIAAIGGMMLFLFDSIRVKHFPMSSMRLVRLILCVTTISSLLNIFTLNAIEGSIKVPLVWTMLALNVFFILEAAVPLLLFCYILLICRRLNEMTWKRFLVRMIPLFAYYILIFINFFTGWIFEFDSMGVFIKGPLYSISYYVLAACYIILSFCYVYKYRERLKKQERAIIWEFFIIGAVVTAFQIYNPNLLLIGFAFLLCNAIIYFSIERPSTYIDNETRLFTKSAYDQYAILRKRERKPYDCIYIDFNDFSEVNELIGYSLGSEFYANVCKTLQKEFSGNLVFKLERERLMIIEEKNRTEEIINRLQKIFSNHWKIGEHEIELTVTIYYISYPKHFTDAKMQREIIAYMAQNCMPDTTSSVTVIRPTEEVIQKYRRYSEIGKAIISALENDTIQVYYQPIMNAEKETLFSAEALIRLTDPKLGFIPPLELIETAEKNGNISAVGERVYEKVCKFIQEHMLMGEISLNRINVNLSAIQCMQTDLAERFIDIAELYGVPGAMINLELTESALISKKSRLLKNMNLLKSKGFTFSCDDYGTGFSTCSYIVDFPFSVVKFDRDIINKYGINKRTTIIINSELMAVKGLELKVVAEGVETKEMLEDMKNLGIDYIQGYYFSRPLPENEFVAYCKKHEN